MGEKQTDKFPFDRNTILFLILLTTCAFEVLVAAAAVVVAVAVVVVEALSSIDNIVLKSFVKI